MFLGHIKKDTTKIPRGSALAPLDRACRARSSNGVNSAWFRAAGFSLLEVIIAIFIIVTVLVGVMTLLSQAITSGVVSSSKLIAANLAQEGIEVVKNIRDLNYGGSGWDDWYSGISGTNNYLVQYNDSSLRTFEDQPLKYDSSTGLYGYDFGIATSFTYKRKITLSKISDVEVKVAAEVTWTEQGRFHSLGVEDRLWNWR